MALAWPARPERNSPWWTRVSHVESGPSQSGGRVTAPKLVMPDQSAIRGSAQTGTSCRQRTSGPSALASSTIFRRNPFRRGGWAFPWKTFHVRTRSGTGRGYSSNGYGRPDARRARRSSRVHAAVRPRARRRTRPCRAPRWSSSRRRFGSDPRPAPTGYRLEESFYRRSSRIDRRRLRLAVKALEHPRAMRRLVRRKTRRPPPPVARRPRARPGAAPHPDAARVHGA